MLVKVHGDRKMTKTRLSWHLRMLPEDDQRLLVRAHGPGGGAPTTKRHIDLRDDLTAIHMDDQNTAPHSFEIVLVEELGRQFAGRKRFIEDLERIVPTF